MSANLKIFARNARCTMTAAEDKLWHYLRSGLALKTTHFRRQVIFKPFIVDFCCHASRLIIEVDGATHSTPQEIQGDQIRTYYLESIGYRVLRVTNDDVFRDIGSVMDMIYAALEQTPHVISDSEKIPSRHNNANRTKLAYRTHTPTPYPSPQGGGEIKNDTAQFLISPAQEGEETKSDETRDHTSFPSPLEGEGQGGG